MCACPLHSTFDVPSVPHRLWNSLRSGPLELRLFIIWLQDRNRLLADNSHSSHLRVSPPVCRSVCRGSLIYTEYWAALEPGPSKALFDPHLLQLFNFVSLPTPIRFVSGTLAFLLLKCSKLGPPQSIRLRLPFAYV